MLQAPPPANANGAARLTRQSERTLTALMVPSLHMRVTVRGATPKMLAASLRVDQNGFLTVHHFSPFGLSEATLPLAPSSYQGGNILTALAFTLLTCAFGSIEPVFFFQRETLFNALTSAEPKERSNFRK